MKSSITVFLKNSFQFSVFYKQKRKLPVTAHGQYGVSQPFFALTLFPGLHIFYDSCLGIEAYQLSGIVQKFPNHFHECYVVGFIEGGCRHLWCRGSEYDLSKGDLILFNPKDNHFCSPMNGELLDYRA